MYRKLCLFGFKHDIHEFNLLKVHVHCITF